MRLTDHEAEDLRYLWQSYASDLGIRSVQGAIEQALLLREPPSDLRRPAVDELQRIGGRAAEGRFVRHLMSSQRSTRREAVQAVSRLVTEERIEKVATERPEPPTTCDLAMTGKSCRHPCSLCEWTGFDLRLVEQREAKGPTEGPVEADPKNKAWRARVRAWYAQDEALEREHHTLAVSETQGSKRAGRDELLSKRKRRQVDIAQKALEMLSHFDAHVLQLVYGGIWPTEATILDAVRAMMGGSLVKAKASIDRACDAYRCAREVALDDLAKAEKWAVCRPE